MVTPAAGAPGGLTALRVGFGCATREFRLGARLCLGGAELDLPLGLSNSVSDGDILCRAVLDAVLAACGMPDLSTLFPPEDPLPSQTDSLVLLSQTITGLLRAKLAGVVNLSAHLAPAWPELAAERPRLITMLSSALQVEPAQVSLSFGQAPRPPQAGDQLTTYATVLCQLKAAVDAASTERKLTSMTSALPFTVPEPPPEEIELPSGRAHEFEAAVKTKLPPLPKAPPPEAGDALIVYTDGACRGNPGPASTGWVVFNAQGMLVQEGGSALGERTNNQAEYEAVIEAARWVQEKLGRDFKLEFRLDSELAVKQLRGEWKIKDAELKQLALLAMNQMMFFSACEIKHVPRQENQRADALANRVLDEQK